MISATNGTLSTSECYTTLETLTQQHSIPEDFRDENALGTR